MSYNSLGAAQLVSLAQLLQVNSILICSSTTIMDKEDAQVGGFVDLVQVVSFKGIGGIAFTNVESINSVLGMIQQRSQLILCNPKTDMDLEKNFL